MTQSTGRIALKRGEPKTAADRLLLEEADIDRPDSKIPGRHGLSMPGIALWEHLMSQSRERLPRRFPAECTSRQVAQASDEESSASGPASGADKRDPPSDGEAEMFVWRRTG